jgi:hypothetical protein
MTGNDFGIFLAKDRFHAPSDVAMRCTVEPPLANRQSVPPLVRDGVVPIGFRDRLVEIRLQRSDQRDLGDGLSQLPHRCQVGRIVSRGDRVDFLHRRQHLFVDAKDPLQPSSMDRFESDRGKLTGILQTARHRIGQLAYAGPHRLAVMRDRKFHLTSLRSDLDKTPAHRRPDPLHTTPRKLGFGRHIVESIFEAGRSEIRNEHLHGGRISVVTGKEKATGIGRPFQRPA